MLGSNNTNQGDKIMGKGFAKQKKQMRKMQEDFAKMQEEIEQKEGLGTAGNGLVTVTLNGNHEMTKITIKPDCVDPDDIEGLEDLIKEACNDATQKLQENMPEMPGLPPGMGF